MIFCCFEVNLGSNLGLNQSFERFCAVFARNLSYQLNRERLKMEEFVVLVDFHLRSSGLSTRLSCRYLEDGENCYCYRNVEWMTLRRARSCACGARFCRC